MSQNPIRGDHVRVLLCPLSDPGYLYPAVAVGRELTAAGHDVRVLGNQAAQVPVAVAGLTFQPAELHQGSTGFRVGRWFLDGDKQFLNVIRAARDYQPDVLLTSVLSLGALLAGEVLDLPVVVLGLATHIWDYANEPGPASSQRRWRTEQLLGQYRDVRERVGLRPRRDARATKPLHGAGLLLRGDISLEDPAAELPPETLHVGPCDWEPQPAVEELATIDGTLSNKPVAYAHLGRMFGGESLWPRLNAAFRDGPMQAIVERGRSGPDQADPEADLLVLHKPWLTELVARADLVLTSGTSAPTLAALQRARPLVMAPAGSEQPLLTEACVRAGVAVELPATTDAHVLQGVLDQVRHDDLLAAAGTRLAMRLRAAPRAAGAAAFVATAARAAGPRTELAG